MTPIEIFLLGWNECLRAIDGATEHDYYVVPLPPSPDRILELMRECQPKPKGPPYDVADLKEYNIG
jgi:hypothetical protein